MSFFYIRNKLRFNQLSSILCSWEKHEFISHMDEIAGQTEHSNFGQPTNVREGKTLSLKPEKCCSGENMAHCTLFLCYLLMQEE